MQKTLKILPMGKHNGYSDIEVIEGLQCKNRRIEDWFYHSTKKYFDNHYNKVFFDKDKKQEIFQIAFLKLWTEICNGKIKLVDGVMNRQQKNGNYMPMTCQLTTFLMTFAKNEYRELLRSNHLDTYDDIYDNDIPVNFTYNTLEEDVEELKNRVVDECIQMMPHRCIEILTMFYYEGKSLDEILEIRKENSSKNGLKTAKNKCMSTLREKILVEYRKIMTNIA